MSLARHARGAARRPAARREHSSTSTRSCAKQCARPSRACRSRTSRSSTCRRAKARCQTAGASDRPLRDAGESRRTPRELDKIQRYNEDDCRSTHLLRDWLLGHRPAGSAVVRPDTVEAADEKDSRARSDADRASSRQDSRAIAQALLGGLPDDRTAWGADEHVRALVFDLLDFHRRAAKPAWWAMFARRDMTDDELIDDVECLGGLTRIADSRRCRASSRCVYDFTFPEQETKLRVGKDMLAGPTRRSARVTSSRSTRQARTDRRSRSASKREMPGDAIDRSWRRRSTPTRCATRCGASRMPSSPATAASRQCARCCARTHRRFAAGLPERRCSLARDDLGSRARCDAVAGARRQLSVRAGAAGRGQDDDRVAS